MNHDSRDIQRIDPDGTGTDRRLTLESPTTATHTPPTKNASEVTDD